MCGCVWDLPLAPCLLGGAGFRWPGGRVRLFLGIRLFAWFILTCFGSPVTLLAVLGSARG